MIVGVSGSTRSGTTLVMGMLHAGGLPTYAENNVAFESHDIFRLPADHAWLDAVEGKAIKLLEPLYLAPLPIRDWRFILMTRDEEQQAKSQLKFLNFLGGTLIPERSWKRMAKSLRTDVPRMRALLGERGAVLEIAFEAVLAKPFDVAEKLADFVGMPLDCRAMAQRVIPRSPKNYPGLLETRFLNDGVHS